MNRSERKWKVEANMDLAIAAVFNEESKERVSFMEGKQKAKR